MEHEDHQGVLMRGIGRWLVYGRLRAWLGVTLEMPSLLRGVRFPPGAQCLDIATGLGWATVGLVGHEPTARVVALEYDGTILSRTRKYLKSHGAANAALCRADAKHLPFSDESFDLVLCVYGLHHFRGYLEALREIVRVLFGSYMSQQSHELQALPLRSKLFQLSAKCLHFRCAIQTKNAAQVRR